MKKTISIIGGGAAALFLAAMLDHNKYSISVFEKNKSLGRKFLVAGKGGFNLTHSEPIEEFIKRYSPVSFLHEAISKFDSNSLRKWFLNIGIPTYIGSSKRIYPLKGIKPIEVLRLLLQEIDKKQVSIFFSHEWTAWNPENRLVFNHCIQHTSDIVVFALGGSSWKVTGSDGKWLDLFKKRGIDTFPFESSNCAYHINWPKEFIENQEGKALKNISVRCQQSKQKGEVVITKFGLEGNAIYALSPQIREELHSYNKANIFLDLKPRFTEDNILERLNKSRFKNTSFFLRNELLLSDVQIALLKTYISKEAFLHPVKLAKAIKNLPLIIKASAPVDEAISTVGGIHLEAVDSNFQIKSIPDFYCIGEMLDWDAPTGGYLLQACFSMAAYLANHLNRKN